MKKSIDHLCNNDHSSDHILEHKLSVRHMLHEHGGHSFCELLKKYCLILWDGLAFFADSVFKLERLRGRKTGWCDKLKSKRDLFRIVTYISLLVYIVASEASKQGTVSTQEIHEGRE